MIRDPHVEDLLRALTPQVLSALTRRHGAFDACEDAVQEALLAAATQWPDTGIPANPRSWLITVADRRLTDEVRSAAARRRRERSAEQLAVLPVSGSGPGLDVEDRPGDRDDSLTLLFLCCHPVLAQPAQVALTLRSVAGLSTAQIAAAYLVPEATMGQRISRAKRRLSDAGARFAMPGPAELPDRLDAVRRVLYLVFNEGYTATSGPDLTVPALSTEAIRLTRQLHTVLPDDAEVSGLLALMLLTEARRAARTAADGALVPLAEQDRARWNRALLDEGLELVASALSAGAPVGPYQLQAAVAAVHSEATSTASTDWAQILGLYALLDELAPNPVVTVNRAVALAMTYGPDAGLRLLDTLTDDARINISHRLPAVRAHLLEMAGDHDDARQAYLDAARRTTSGPEVRYLTMRAAALTVDPGPTSRTASPTPPANQPTTGAAVRERCRRS